MIGAVASLYLASSCSDDDTKKKEPPSDASGGNGGGNSGGSSAGGKGGTPNGGSAGQPQGGSGGQGGAAGEAQGGEPQGGTPGEGGMGGIAMGGEGGGGETCGTPATIDLSCNDAITDLNLRYDSATRHFIVDVSGLPRIVNAVATYFDYIDDGEGDLISNGCGVMQDEGVLFEDSSVVFRSTATESAVRVTLNSLWLQDECGNEYDLVISNQNCVLPAFDGDAGEVWMPYCDPDTICQGCV